ncbi:MAG TPA: hypothetical protein V6C69_17915 [Trichormus sp.]
MGDAPEAAGSRTPDRPDYTSKLVSEYINGNGGKAGHFDEMDRSGNRDGRVDYDEFKKYQAQHNSGAEGQLLQQIDANWNKMANWGLRGSRSLWSTAGEEATSMYNGYLTTDGVTQWAKDSDGARAVQQGADAAREYLNRPGNFAKFAGSDGSISKDEIESKKNEAKDTLSALDPANPAFADMRKEKQEQLNTANYLDKHWSEFSGDSWGGWGGGLSRDAFNKFVNKASVGDPASDFRGADGTASSPQAEADKRTAADTQAKRDKEDAVRDQQSALNTLLGGRLRDDRKDIEHAADVASDPKRGAAALNADEAQVLKNALIAYKAGEPERLDKVLNESYAGKKMDAKTEAALNEVLKKDGMCVKTEKGADGADHKLIAARVPTKEEVAEQKKQEKINEEKKNLGDALKGLDEPTQKKIDGAETKGLNPQEAESVKNALTALYAGKLDELNKITADTYAGQQMTTKAREALEANLKKQGLAVDSEYAEVGGTKIRTTTIVPETGEKGVQLRSITTPDGKFHSTYKPVTVDASNEVKDAPAAKLNEHLKAIHDAKPEEAKKEEPKKEEKKEGEKPKPTDAAAKQKEIDDYIKTWVNRPADHKYTGDHYSEALADAQRNHKPVVIVSSKGYNPALVEQVAKANTGDAVYLYVDTTKADIDPRLKAYNPYPSEAAQSSIVSFLPTADNLGLCNPVVMNEVKPAPQAVPNQPYSGGYYAPGNGYAGGYAPPSGFAPGYSGGYSSGGFAPEYAGGYPQNCAPQQRGGLFGRRIGR